MYVEKWKPFFLPRCLFGTCYLKRSLLWKHSLHQPYKRGVHTYFPVSIFFVKLQRNNSTSRFSPPPAVHFTKPSCAGPFPFRNLSQCLGWIEGFLGAHLHLPEGCSCKRRTQVPNLLQTRPRFLMKCKARWFKCGFSSYRSHFLKLKTSQAE